MISRACWAVLDCLGDGSTGNVMHGNGNRGASIYL